MAVDKQREIFVEDMRRLQEAAQKSDSRHLRKDYKKALNRMQRELREYDAYRKSNG